MGTLEINGTKLTSDAHKENAMADRLEKNFKKENNTDFNNDQYSRINKIIEEEEIENLYTKNHKRINIFSMQELKREIKKFNKKTSIDQNGVSNKMLNNISEITMLFILSRLSNCLNSFEIPKNWEVSNFTIILKKRL